LHHKWLQINARLQKRPKKHETKFATSHISITSTPSASKCSSCLQVLKLHSFWLIMCDFLIIVENQAAPAPIGLRTIE
jgi:hypothetical protein